MIFYELEDGELDWRCSVDGNGDGECGSGTGGGCEPSGKDETGQGRRADGWGREGVPGDSVCRATGGAAALEAADARGEVERGAVGDGVRVWLHAAVGLSRHDVSRCRYERGLPDAERVDAGDP